MSGPIKPNKHTPMSVRRKQARLARERVKDPDATLRELAQRADYSDSANVSRSLKLPAVKQKVAELMDARPKLRDEALFKKLEEGLDAKTTKFFAHEGTVVDERETIDFPTRHKYLETALVMKGHKRADDQAPTGAAMMVNIFTALEDAKRAGILLGPGRAA